MDRELTPEEIESLLPAYALDAIDDGERTAIEAYLETHPDARAEAFSLQQTASLLGHSGGPAPAAVWDKLELAITSAPAPVVPPTPTVGPPAPVPIEQARSRRRRPVGWLVAAAALLVVLVAGAVVVAVNDHGGGARPSQAALASAAKDANDAPGARHVVLADASGHQLASVVILRDGTGYLTATAMPRLDASHTYQLWALTNQHTISLGVMGTHPKIVAFTAAGDPLGLAITTEVAGGVAVSTQRPDAVGNLT